MMNILVINPGSTSTKIAYYQNKICEFERKIEYQKSELSRFKTIADQKELRSKDILDILSSWRIDLNQIDGIAARGGLLKPLKSGGYEINDKMLDDLVNRPRQNHASNLGAIIADEIRSKSDKAKAYIYDPVTVDEFAPLSKISGLNGIERESIGHALNTRAVARKAANKLKLEFNKSTFIVAHLGGGNTIGIFVNGKMIDLLSDDEGPFSTERTGGLPLKKVIEWNQKYSKEEMMKSYRENGGLESYLNTNDLRIVEEMIDNNDKEALLVFNAMAYQISKGVGEMSVVNCGKVDGIVLTGGLAYSKRMVKEIRKRVSFIAPLLAYPGEMEMEALYLGVERILNGEEVNIYT